jgi:hypothetical protein
MHEVNPHVWQTRSLTLLVSSVRPYLLVAR